LLVDDVRIEARIGLIPQGLRLNLQEVDHASRGIEERLDTREVGDPDPEPGEIHLGAEDPRRLDLQRLRIHHEVPLEQEQACPTGEAGLAAETLRQICHDLRELVEVESDLGRDDDPNGIPPVGRGRNRILG
jgi:hypothetical protein